MISNVQAYCDPLTGLATDSSAFRRRAPRVMLSDDPDTATAQTVQEMCRQIHAAAHDPLVRAIAQRAVRQFKRNPRWACFWWCKHYLTFKHHGSMFEAWSGDLGDPRTKLQLLISPDVLVRMRRLEGDCAIYTMMLCALLESLGLSWEIITLAVDRQQPEVFSHVCARSAGETLDASHGAAPGWEVPARDVFRRWVFDSAGNRTEYGGRFRGLHSYQARKRGMWGMGDFCDDYPEECGQAGPSSSTSSASLPYYDATQIFQGNPTGPVPYSGTIMTAPANNSAQWASFAAQLVKSGMTLAQINAIQPGTVVSANGAILRQNPGYSVPAGGAINASFGGGNTILYIGLGLVGIFAVSMLKGGGR